MKHLLLFAVLALLGPSHAFAQQYESKILEQKSAPVVIEEYQAAYQRRVGAYQREGIRHSLKYRSNTDRPIIALQFGLVSFDIWDEFLDRMGGVTMESLKPSEKKSGEWIATAYADFSFRTGVAYVSKVRFADGEIWTVDLDWVLAQMRKIEKDFDAKNLKKKNEPLPKPDTP